MGMSQREYHVVRDAIEGYLEIMRDEGWPVPAARDQ
jgi:hypothetical protein